MISFQVNDMTCGHCASTITKAVHALDAHAKVEIDLAEHLVRIDPTKANDHDLGEAIRKSGYTPAAMESQSTGAAPSRAGGCCCG